MLSTCNRTELYLVARGRTSRSSRSETLTELAGDRGDDLSAALYRLRDESAALHLFRVAAGLDSLVPGEGEILGQVRTAFEAGSPGPFLDKLFRQALHAGRRVRLETAISESPASVPSAAAALAQQVFDDLTGRRVLVLGAGKMSEATARNLASRGRGRRRRREPDAGARRGARAAAGRTGDRARGDRRRSSSTPTSSSPRRAPPTTSSRATPSHRRSAPGRGGRCSWSTSRSRATSIRRSTSSTAASSTTSTTSRQWSPRRSPAGATEAARAERLVADEADRFREWQAVARRRPDDRVAARAGRGDPRQRAGTGRRAAVRARAKARRVGDVADPREAPAPADDPHERGGRGSRWGGLC